MLILLRRKKLVSLLGGILVLLLTNPVLVRAARNDRNDKEEQEIANLRNMQETTSKILAETVQNIETIRREIQEIKGAVEETRHFFEEESRKNGKLLNDFDLRLTGIEERLSLHGDQIQEILSSGSGKRGGDAHEEGLYRKALSHVNTQDYKQAIALFDQFIKKYPKSSLADNAQYWKGESYFALKDYPNAVVEFQKLVKSHPRSDKVPGAILKQGYSFYEKKEYQDAKVFLQKVMTDYPNSEEAGQAKERIAMIDQILAKGPMPANNFSPMTQSNSRVSPP